MLTGRSGTLITGLMGSVCVVEKIPLQLQPLTCRTDILNELCDCFVTDLFSLH